MLNKKILLTILGIVILIIAIGAGVFLVQRQQELRKQAAPATNLSLLPATVNTDVDQTFSLSVTIDTGVNTVTATEIHVTYDPQVVQAQSVTAGGFLPVVLLPASTDNTTGKVSITVGSQPTAPQQGTGTLATITFKALTSGPASISFDSGTQVAGINAESVLAGTSPATITIAALPTATASPTTTATPTSTATATATPINTTNPTSTATPIRTASPTVKASSTTKATSKSTAKAKASASPSLPVAGVSWPGVAAAVGGALLLIFGILLAF